MVQSMLKGLNSSAGSVNGGSKCLDLLVCGVETSLWIGEQFVKDLRSVLPSVSLKVI